MNRFAFVFLFFSIHATGAFPGEALADGPVRPSVDARRPVLGTTSPRREVVLFSPIDGILRSVLVEEGSFVKVDQPLARLDNQVQTARVAAASAASKADGDLKAARLRLTEATRRQARMKKAHQQSAAADWELEQAQMLMDQASAAVDQAKERREESARQLDVEKSILDQYTVGAPFSGLVTAVHYDEGASLKRSDPLIEVVSLDELEAEVFVPGKRFGELVAGERYHLKAGAPVGRTLDAQIATVDPVLDSASGTFRVVLRIDNEDGELPAGFSVELGSRINLDVDL